MPKEALKDIKELRFIFTSPTFTTEKTPKQQREFYIPRLDRERTLYGSEFEVKLRNELTQKAIARECAEWIRQKVCFKSNKTNEQMMGFINLDDTSYSPINGFTTVDLGCEKGNTAYTMIQKAEAPFSKAYIDLFNQIWNDSSRLQVVTEEVIDSIMDLGLNEFRLDLLEYINGNHDVEHTPNVLHAVVQGNEQAPAGTIFVLKNRTRVCNRRQTESYQARLNGRGAKEVGEANIDHKNQLHPFYMVYIRDDGEVMVDHLHPKDLLDKMRLICKPMTKPDVSLCREFNKETRDGLRMGKYSDLLSKAINSIISVKEQSDVDSFLEGFAGELFEERYVGLDDFELICFLVIK